MLLYFDFNYSFLNRDRNARSVRMTGMAEKIITIPMPIATSTPTSAFITSPASEIKHSSVPHIMSSLAD
jgi:hypothetical protein